MFVCLDQSGCTIWIRPTLVGIGINGDTPAHWYLVGRDGRRVFFFLRTTTFEFCRGALCGDGERMRACMFDWIIVAIPSGLSQH